MRIVFSRKGFDSAAGGGPSPIVEGPGGGRPVSLPIPAGAASRTRYGDLGLGALVVEASRGRLGPDDLCHHDPMFLGDGADGRCAFGQCGAAQSHLRNQGVGRGDVFVFFGLFAHGGGRDPHHRIFGFLEVEQVVDLAADPPHEKLEELRALGHPHALALHHRNDCVYLGRGAVAQRASAALRLTVPEGPPSLWKRPAWLRPGELSYHHRAERWLSGGRLKSVARGQEFVVDIAQRKAPREWLRNIIAEITSS